MKLYNSLIQEIPTHFGGSAPVVWPYSPGDCWTESQDFELVMMRDAACELGGNGKPGIGFTCVTTDPALVPRDEILLYGKDLRDLKDNCSYARIALIQVADIESDDEDDTE